MLLLRLNSLCRSIFMARPNPIRAIMEAPLPSRTYQRSRLFRPSYDDVGHIYKIINRHIFNNSLRRPAIELGATRKCWAYCGWYETQQSNGSYCQIKLNSNWFCPQWFVNTLAHEMVHQYQWDVYRWEHIDEYGRNPYNNSGGHGPTFFAWREQFALYGLTLKTSYGQRRWFRRQSFAKC